MLKKRFLQSAALAGAVVAVAMTASCGKDDDGSGGGAGLTELVVAVKNGSEYASQIDTVKIAFHRDGRWVVLAAAAYGSEGKFTLKLPASVDAAYLREFSDEDKVRFTITDPSAKNLKVEGLTAFKGGVSSGWLSYRKGTAPDETVGILSYWDKAVKITGKHGENYDLDIKLDLKQGWNLIFFSSSEKTTTDPGGLEWVYESDTH